MAAADYYSQVQQAYIAYYGRPADPAGLIYWANQLNQAGGDLNQIINAFGNSAESTALYSSGNLYTELNQIYQTLFGRDADSAGANYYVEQIQTGKMTLASIALNVYNGAQGSDADALAAKLQFATAFTNDLLQSSTAAAAYGGDAAAGNARTALLGVTDSASAQTAINNLPTTIANIGTGAVTYLTAGADVVTGSNIVGSLTSYISDGKGPTLNYNDVITGSTGGTNNTLTLNDDYASGTDVIPLGASISNIQNVVLQTAGNAGSTGTFGLGAGSQFDTTNISGVTSVAVKSAGAGTDSVRAAATTDISVTHLSTVSTGGVYTQGGKNVTVNTAGGNVQVGDASIAGANPTGAVNVAAANKGTVTVLGGTTVTVNDAGQGSIVTVGYEGAAATSVEPTGAVTVNATGSASTVNVYGGTDVTVSTVGGDASLAGGVNVGGIAGGSGGVGGTVYAPTGNVTVTVNEAQAYNENYAATVAAGHQVTAGYKYDVNVLGGANVSVTTNAGDVTIGGTTVDATGALVAGENPTGTVNVTETSNVSKVAVYGGTDVTVNAAGGEVDVGSVISSTVAATPSGAVTVNNTASVAYDGILNTNDNGVYVRGGTNVNVTTNAGDVRVGSWTGEKGAQPTGTVTVTDTTAENVAVYGGTDVTVSSAGGHVRVGSDNAGAFTTGDVTVNESAVQTGGNFNSTVVVVGGDNVTVNTTGGGVAVGTATNATTGAVSITDTFVGNGNQDSFSVVGGTTVSINTTATSGTINVGNVTANIDSVTGALKNASDYASGNVTIVNESKAGTSAAGASNVYGTSSVNVGTDGATSVSITGAKNAVITDIQTELSKGVSTLSNVSLDHVEGNVSINSDALTSLTVLNGSSGGAVYTVNNATAGHDLALTLGGDAVSAPSFLYDTVADATAGAVTVADNGVASGAVLLDVATATSVTVNTTAALTLGIEASDNLTSVTLNNTAALNLSLEDATSLATIDASAAKGAVTVEIDPTVTSFKGGAGNDVVTLDSNSLLHSDDTTYSSISGGAGNNTLVANYAGSANDVALGNNAHITGFTTLALGNDAVSDTHFGTVYNAGSLAVAAKAQSDTVTLSGTVTLDDVVSITLNGATYSHTVTGVDTLASIVSDLASQITAAGVGVTASFTAGSPVLTLTANTAGTAFTVGAFSSTDSTLVAPGSETGAAPTVVQANQAAVPAVIGDGAYDASGFSALQVGGTQGDVSFTNVAAGATLDVTASQGGSAIVNYVLAKDTAHDALALTVGGSSNVSTTIAANNIETLNITSQGAAGTVNNVTIADGAATTVVVSGANDVALTLEYVNSTTGVITAGQSNVASVDASAATGKVDLTGIALSQSGATVKGGAGLLTVNVDASANNSDVVTTGSGGGNITIGNGGSWNSSTSSYGAGTETINLTASESAVDTLTIKAGTVAVNNGTTGGVTGFQVSASGKTTDRLTLGSTGVTALSNQTAAISVAAFTVDAATDVAAAGAALANLTFTSSNGVVTFGAAGTHTVSEFSTSQLIAAAQAIADAAGPNTVLAFEAGGNTYVVAATGAVTEVYNASVTELVGVKGVAGFGTTAAGNTIVLTNAITTDTNTNDVAAAGTKALSYDETGYARAVLNATSVDAAATSVTLSNLAASAVLEVSADLSNVAVSTTQLGTSGSDSLTVLFDGTETVKSLTVTGDNALAIQTNGTDIVKAFVDASNTVASITVTGSGSLEIDSLSGTALKSFDASGLTAGSLNLTASQDGLSIAGSSHGDTIVANGAADTITVNASAADVSITANGAGDTITLSHVASGTNTILAAGAGDTISVDGGTNYIGGTISGTNLQTALGHGDTVNLLGSSVDTVWVGGSSTVNLGTSASVFTGTANITVTGDVTGANSSGSYAETVISGTDHMYGSLNLTFNNVATEALAGGNGSSIGGNALAASQVNVASATSLSQALDLAVNQALVLDYQNGHANTQVVNGVLELNAKTGLITTFQYAGNTYVVEAVNNTTAAAAHTALGANDVVIELTGQTTSAASYMSGNQLHTTIHTGVVS